MFNRTFNFLSILTLISVFVLLARISCTDPDEYNPQIQKIPPPDPPEVINPLLDTVICGGPVFFDWTVPAGSEIFQIQTDTTPSFNTAEMFQTFASAAILGLEYYGTRRITYYARIRAGSSGWSDYTVWSDIRRFYLWQES
ncbi:MAG: hypothetical protein JSV98_00825 [candidate division WOR-3 bacterium]|nr:MAG: hypothetical protein JSV98_00825 [candidate division WOR-3 bacterium]